MNNTASSRPTRALACGAAVIGALILPALAATPAFAADAPVANPDIYYAFQDVPFSVSAAGGVLSNDSCVGAINGIQNFDNNELTMHEDGSFEYVTPAGFYGTRTFEYMMICSGVASGFTTVQVVFQQTIVSPPVPVGAADTYSTQEGVTLTVPAPGLLANDTNALAVVAVEPLLDGLTVQLDGSFVYVPPVGTVGDVTFSYRISDGSDTLSEYIPVTISVTAIPAVTTETTDPNTLANTGEATGWLVTPALALLTAGLGAMLFAGRRRTDFTQ